MCFLVMMTTFHFSNDRIVISPKIKKIYTFLKIERHEKISSIFDEIGLSLSCLMSLMFLMLERGQAMLDYRH